MTPPDTMLAARAYEGANELKLEQIPVPEPGPGEVLVKIHASGVVRGMLTLWRGGRIPNLPATLGPAMAGEIADVGNGVSRWSPAQRVRVHPNLSCRNCEYCRSDREMMCSAHSIMGHSSFGPDAAPLYERYHNGGLAQYALAHESSIDPLPDNVSFRVAAKIRDIGTAYGSLENAAVPKGGTLLITAATGSQGVSAIRLAPFFGIGRVIALGRTNDRLATVKALNPELVETLALEDLDGWEDSDLLVNTLREMTGGGPAGLFDLTPPQGGAVSWHAVRSLRRGATAVMVGGSLAPPDFSVQELMINCTRIVGWRNCGREGQRAITDLIASGQLEVDDLITHHFKLEDINDAVRAVENRTEPMWMCGVDVVD